MRESNIRLEAIGFRLLVVRLFRRYRMLKLVTLSEVEEWTGNIKYYWSYVYPY